MHTFLATTLLGLCALQGADRPDAPADSRSTGRVSPERLTPVDAGEHECVFFDEAEMRARLLDPDLAARERSFEHLVTLARHSAPIRATVEAWSRERGALEIAWTARLMLRELEREPLATTTQILRFHLHEPRPWEQQYRELFDPGGSRALLDRLGLDPDEFRISGLVRLSPEQAEQIGTNGTDSGGGTPPFAQDVGRGSAPHEPAAEVLGVVCDESLEDRVVLTRVVPGSIADAIGLTPGDRLLRIGELELGRPEDVTEAMHRWNDRGADAPDVLEVHAVDAGTGDDKLRVWAPYVSGR